MQNVESETVTVHTPRPVKGKSYLRAWVAITMLVSWPVVTISGFLLWLAPEGQRSGKQELFMGLTKSEWGDIHTWISLAAVVITVAHLVVDWKALKGAIRYLATVHRERWPLAG